MTDEPDVEVGDDTPKLEEQARLNGWRAGVFDFGTRDNEPGVDLFNPGLVQRPDGLWMLVRRSENQEGLFFGKNGIWACELRDKKPHGGPLLKFPDSESDQQFEDARAITWNNQTWVSCCNFTWYSEGNWTGAHQAIGVFKNDSEWTPIARKDPPVGKNRDAAGDTMGKHEKNWVFFIHENRMHLLYQANPWTVIAFGDSWEDQKRYVGPSLTTSHGEVRGGTPPVLANGLLWSFYHSSVPWRGRYRRYHMGAVGFEAKPPFKPVRITQQPLLTGSQNDYWRPEKPLVVFPCGAVFEDDAFFITYGINDLKCGYVHIPYEDILKLAQPIADPSQSLIDDQAAGPVTANDALWRHEISPEVAQAILHPEEHKKEMQRERMAKARATLAAKRAAGLITNKPRRKRKRKELKQNGKARSINATCQPSQK